MFWKKRQSVKTVLCSAPWINCIITLDGIVRPCCWSSPLPQSNLNRRTIQEIWEKDFEAYRKGLRKHQMPSVCHCIKQRGEILATYRNKEVQEPPLLPTNIELELTTKCNLRCVMCHFQNQKHVEERHLALSILESLRPFMENAKYLSLHGSGEFFMYKYWKELLSLLPKQIATVAFNSNGISLTEENIKLIAHSPVNQINFSLDAGTPETYHAIRGANFERVINNIKQLSAYCQAHNCQMNIITNMTLMKKNIGELIEFVNVSKAIGAFMVVVWLLNDFDYAVVERPDFTFRYEEQKLERRDPLVKDLLKQAQMRAEELGLIFRNDTGISL